MNKISKKIVALATMAAFVLTLVPTAAFAVGSSVAVDETEVTIDGSTGVAEVTVTANIDKDDVGHNVLVWAEKDGALYRYADYEPVTGTEYNAEASDKGDWMGVAILNNHAENEGAGEYQVTMKLKNDGDYTIWVASNLVDVDNPDGGAENPSQATKLASTSVHVNAASSTVTKIVASEDEVSYSGTPDGVHRGASVTATAWGKYDNADTEVELADKVITINLPAGFEAVDAAGKVITEVESGEIFYLIADKSVTDGVYTVALSCEGVPKNILVNVNTATGVPTTVEAVDTGKDVTVSRTTDASSVAQVVFKDEDGNVVTFKDDTAANAATTVRVMNAPNKFKGGSFTVAKVDDSKYYGLFASKNLVAGDYKVRVALNEKDSVDLSFSVKDFGKVVDSKVVITKDNVEVTNVYPDVQYTGIVYQVDENGLEQVATNTTDMIVGMVKGANIAKIDFTGTAASGKFTFTVPADKDNENLIGSEITVMAYGPQDKINAQTTVTVADPANLDAIELAFDSEAGEAGQWNEVGVTLVDANGDAVTDVKATGKNVSAVVVEKSNEDANVQASISDVEKGEATLKVYSDKETTADILVVVRDGNKAIYANTLTYAFGEQDIPVDTTVVMTIGSSEFVVNDEVITKEDSAPYIANDRTYVPFRALGEALGAEVNWDNDARTVTYTLGNTEVVLTIDETTYTVNGDEKTMDVAPVITGDRTYVPVRFVGEALGFSVTALYDTNGTTASVVFQK